VGKKRGYIAFVLHSHLPYVLGHGTWPHGAEWLYEAASETYIPLYRHFRKLKDEGIDARVTIGLTPVLSEQLVDERFKKGFVEYLNQKIESAKEDKKYFERKKEDLLSKTAQLWIEFYSNIKETFFHINHDIPAAFRKLQEEGAIEIITSGATHGYAPLLSHDESVKGQIKEGKKSYKRIYGKEPLGLWPPELAYRPRYRWKRPTDGKEYLRKGVEEIYFEEGIKYFLVDAHLLKGGKPIGTYLSLFEGLKILWERFREQYRELEKKELSVYRPYFAISEGTKKPVGFFTRDPNTALQVWSKDWGYPGDPLYLEFHKKHFPGGHRYWRITNPDGDLATKEPYNPQSVEIPLSNQSDHFVGLIEKTINETDIENPIIVSPYDAELYGHWWFEGPRWLYLVLKKISASKIAKSITLSEYFEKYPPELTVGLPEGSWGEGGFHWVWLNEWTEWTWKVIYELEDRFFDLLYKTKRTALIERLFKQAARELLLLESSDWQFLITTWSARDYAEERVMEHADYLRRILDIIENLKGEGLNREDEEFIRDLEDRDRLFPDIDPYEWKEEKK